MDRELLIDKYRPSTLKELSYNRTANQFLSIIAHKQNMPHIILEGPRGCGKHIRAELYIREKYGDIRINSGVVYLDVPGKTETKPVHVLYSKYHHQFNPSIHNIYDRSLIQCFISEIVQTKLLIDIPYRIIIVEDADRLSVEAQESLRRTLETCVSTCRFIFLVNNEDHIIAPIYSRCINVRLSAPTIAEIVDIFTDIAVKEGRAYKREILEDIAHASGRNLHKAINMFNRFMIIGNQTFNHIEYDGVYDHCNKIIDALIKGQTIDGTIDNIRLLLYEIVNYCVDCTSLIPILLDITFKRIPENAHEERFHLSKIATERDLSVRSSSKDIYHIESFCLHIFRIVKLLMLTKTRKVPCIKKK